MKVEKTIMGTHVLCEGFVIDFNGFVWDCQTAG